MANSDDRYEMLRDRELSKLSWEVSTSEAWVLAQKEKEIPE